MRGRIALQHLIAMRGVVELCVVVDQAVVLQILYRVKRVNMRQAIKYSSGVCGNYKDASKPQHEKAGEYNTPYTS